MKLTVHTCLCVVCICRCVYDVYIVWRKTFVHVYVSISMYMCIVSVCKSTKSHSKLAALVNSHTKVEILDILAIS